VSEFMCFLGGVVDSAFLIACNNPIRAKFRGGEGHRSCKAITYALSCSSSFMEETATIPYTIIHTTAIVYAFFDTLRIILLL
jgi:hypothetical protein